MTRSRTSSAVHTGYSTDLYTGTTTSVNMEAYLSTCVDNPGPDDCQDFDVTRVVKRGGLINGDSNKKVGSWVRYTNFPCTAQMNDSFYKTHAPGLPSRSDSDDAVTLLSRTNPNRSSIDSLVSLSELRELPGLIKDVGGYRLETLWKHVPKDVFKFMNRAAKVNLIVQFGIAPIIGDIRKLLKFTSLVDSRVQELDRLMERGLRRTITISRDSVTADYPWNTIQSSVVTLHCGIRKVTTREVRGHVRWHPTLNFQMSDKEMRRLASKIVAGGVIDFTTLWEAMPWSWLIDYFTNVGDFISLTRNIIPVTHEVPIIMVHQKTSISSYNHDTAASGRVTCTRILNDVVTKSRRRAIPTLSAHMPFLTGRQTSILGSIAATRL